MLPEHQSHQPLEEEGGAGLPVLRCFMRENQRDADSAATFQQLAAVCATEAAAKIKNVWRQVSGTCSLRQLDDGAAPPAAKAVTQPLSLTHTQPSFF